MAFASAEARKAYRAKNHARIREQERAARASESPERRERRLAYHRGRYQANQVEIEAAKKAARESETPDQRAARLAYASAYAKEHADKFHAATQRRRARYAAGPGVTAAQWAEMLEFFGHRCFFEWCPHEQVLHMSHIVALSRGGEHSIANVVPLCATHNLQQGVRDFYDFFATAEAEHFDRVASAATHT